MKIKQLMLKGPIAAAQITELRGAVEKNPDYLNSIVSTDVTAGVGDCIGRDANNGYEQLFIGTSTQVPEPGSLALVALGLISLGAIARRGRSTGRSLK